MKLEFKKSTKAFDVTYLATLATLALQLVVSGANGGQKNSGSLLPFIRTELLDDPDPRGKEGFSKILLSVRPRPLLP